MCLCPGNQHRHYSCFMMTAGMEELGVPPACLVPTAAVSFNPLSSPTREVSSSAWRNWTTRAPQQAEPGSKPDQVLSSSLSLPLTCPVSLRACWSVHLGSLSLSSLSHPPHPHCLHWCLYTLHNSDLSFRVAFWEPSLPTPLKSSGLYKPPLVVFSFITLTPCLFLWGMPTSLSGLRTSEGQAVS